MRFNSIKFKITILYVIILGAILIAFSGILYLSLRYVLYNELDETLENKATEIHNILLLYMEILGRSRNSFVAAAERAINLESELPDTAGIKEIDDAWQLKIDRMDLREDYINLLTPEGKLIFHSNNFGGKPITPLKRDPRAPSEARAAFKNATYNKRQLRVINIPFIGIGGKPYVIQIGTSLKPVIQVLRNRLQIILISIPIFMLAASFFGRFLVSRILNPVARIAKMARDITHKDLNARVKVEQIDEETEELVSSFNDMISRLDRSFKHIEEFSSHVAHELKTPLAIIRGELEIALRKERGPEDYKKAIKIALEESKRMLSVIENLLLLAKLDYRPEAFTFETLDSNAFFEEVCGYAKILSSPKKIAVTADMPDKSPQIKADNLSLRRLFLNIIDNAVKFTPDNGRVDIRVQHGGNMIVTSVSDTGVGIAEEDLPRIFDKFFHSEKLQGLGESGTGLGLSIAYSIAKLHKGSIEVQSKPGLGATFTVNLPLE